MSLFRKEAVSHQGERLTGEVSLAQPLSIKLTVSILVTITALIVAFLFNANYARKETVRGFLMPNKGVIKSYARQGGIVEKLWVKEGDTVKKGQALATIVIEQRNNQGVELSSQLISQLTKQQQLLQEEISQYQTLQMQELANLQHRQQVLNNEKDALDNQLATTQNKLALYKKQQQNFSALNQQGYLSTLEKERQQQTLLEAEQELQSIERLQLQHQRERSQVAFDIANLPQQYTLRINTLKREQSDINRQLAQVNNNYQYTLSASNDGVVTGIQVVTGEAIVQNKPLLHIVPAGSTLVAELLLPTRSAGFVQQGHQARLRFDAFPYQRFGFISSEITRIDSTLISPNEVQLPVALQEPVYRLQAQLSSQQVSAYGKAFNLKSGMLFEADIMLEKRSLIEWLLEPLYSLQGRVS